MKPSLAEATRGRRKKRSQTEGPGSAPAVAAWVEQVNLPTYLPALPDKNPMFLEKRVYQGSSGRVYPLPFTDRISETKVERKWKAIWLENEYLRVMILPELGGRIHRLLDKTNNYDVIYYQPVVKPALVGLAGPWISGGIEFNWPQHHRPATFLPVDFEIEQSADGSATVWCSDHDPLSRMKGMHGVCLRPGSALLELKVRAYNRTPLPETFLWWANVATRVHEAYQSFFPPDVYYVADHAKRAMSSYPLCAGSYYGVDYGERARKGVPEHEKPAQFVPPHCRADNLGTKSGALGTARPTPGPDCPSYAPNDLSWYVNISTPCSYMCMGSKEDFFGGYDYRHRAGLVHIADHHIAPGKKQWTWGNHPFGYAWDRNLTEPDAGGEYGPYIELMAGVFTDNQPDFAFLQPGETRTWSQYWYPIREIGAVQQANLDAALSLRMVPREGRRFLRVGLASTRAYDRVEVIISASDKVIAARATSVSPRKPFTGETAVPARCAETDLTVTALLPDGKELIRYQPKKRAAAEVPPAATEPPAPAAIRSVDELFVTGLHLAQYRHATRCPTQYWREALRRDPGESRCNNALGLWHLRRGEWEVAEAHFRTAIARLTHRNPNPADGEPYYNLGLCLRYRMDGASGRAPIQGPLFEEAYAAFAKATWNQGCSAAAHLALAEMDCRQQNRAAALEHLNRTLAQDTNNLWARDLKAAILRMDGREKDAAVLLQETCALDPLDWCARWLLREPINCDAQVALDIAHDLARAGLYEEATNLLGSLPLRPGPGTDAMALPDQSWGAAPLVAYTMGWLNEKAGRERNAWQQYRKGGRLSPDYCFPARLEEILVLEAAIHARTSDARAHYYLGNLLYDRRRYPEAMAAWERSARLDPGFARVWRNLGIGYFNILRDSEKARRAYDRAIANEPGDARLLFERDQLWKRLGELPERRLAHLERHGALVRERDDLTVELCALYNQTNRPEEAERILKARHFQPWEGGEGQALGQHTRTQLALGRKALHAGDARKAKECFEAALRSPLNLGEARHLLANQSDAEYWLGCACEAAGDREAAEKAWRRAAEFRGDFQQMSVRSYSEQTYYSALSWEKLGQAGKAIRLYKGLLLYSRRLKKTRAVIDYFATSLPTMLLFEDDLQARQETTALFLEGQALLGLRRRARARHCLRTVLKRDPNHAEAADMLDELADR
jgi:tetratricopeptide (TPR) repeat protein